MKRVFSILVVVLLLVNMISCGSKKHLSFVCTKDSVDEFLTVAGYIYGEDLLSGMSITEDNMYNVTPPEVSAVTDVKIFKDSDSCASFILIDNEIYSICESFGGYGFVNAVPCDFDGDGNVDLLVASSCGSGLHRSVISIFNTKTKESTVVYDTSTTDDPQIDLFVAAASPAFSSKDPADLPIYYHVYSAEIKVNDNNFADLSGEMIDIVGTVEYENGAVVFKPTAT